MSVMSGFRSSNNNGLASWASGYTQQQQQYAAQAAAPPPASPTELDAEQARAEYLRALKVYDYQTSPSIIPMQASGMTSFNVPGAEGRPANIGRAGRPLYSATTAQTPGGPQSTVIPGRTDRTVDQDQADFMTAVDVPFRAANTAVAGTQLILSSVTPRGMRRLSGVDGDPTDGITIGDFGQMYAAVWEAGVTPGQAIGTSWGDWANLAANVAGDEMVRALDSYIDKDTESRLTDPSNTRGLGSWLSGLHSDFDVFDETSRDSAFNQGVGRWITGTSDAALMWFAGLDVLIAKGIGAGMRNATTKVLATNGAKGTIDPNAFELEWLAHQAGTKKTAEGELIESIYQMTPEQAAHHPLVLDSDNPAAVAQMFGAKFNNRREALDAFLAAAGSPTHTIELAKKRKDIYDTILTLRTQREEMRAALRGEPMDDVSQLLPGWGNLPPQLVQQNLRHYDDLYDMAVAEYDRLMQISGQADQLGDDLILRQMIGRSERGFKGKVIRYDKRAGVKTKRSARGMQAKAEARLERFDGTAYEHYLFKLPGTQRTVRFVAAVRSGANYITTHRQTGVLNFQDPVEFMREFRSALEVTPFLRKAARTGGTISRTLPDGTIVEESVGDFRNRLLLEAQEIATKTPAEKAAWIENFEFEMADAMAQSLSARLGATISRDSMAEIARKYMTKRSIVRGHIKDHNWVREGDELIAMDKVTLATQRNGHTLMDFKWLEDVIVFHYKSNAIKKGLNFGEKVLSVIDHIWRPAVLLRLGYTQRNIAEGYLRTLAAFGEIPTYGNPGQTIKKISFNTGDRLAGGVNRTRNVVLKRKGLRKVRKQMNAMRSQLEDDLKRRDLNREELRKARAEIKALHKRLRKQAERDLLDRTRKGMDALERPVYTEISDELFEAQARMIDSADTLIYAQDDVTSIMARGLLEPDPATGVGVADAEALTRRQIGDDAVEIGDGFDDAIALDAMTPGQQARYEQVVADGWDEATGRWLTPQAKAEHEKLLRQGYVRYLNKLARAEYRIGRIDESGQFRVIRSSTFDKLTYDDFTAGDIVAVPKSVKPQYSKVDVYGGVLDIRTNVSAETFNVARQTREARAAVDELRNSQEYMDVLLSAWRGPMGGEVDEFLAPILPSIRNLFGDDFAEYMTSRSAGDAMEAELYGAASQIVRTPDEIVRIADTAIANLEARPELMRGIALRRWIDTNADRLPEGFILWAEKKKLILPNKEIRRLLASEKNIDRKIGTASQRARELRDYLNADSTWNDLADQGFPIHAGRELDGDVVPDVLINDRTMGYLHGPGLYSITNAGMTSRGYYMAHLRGRSDVDGGTPVVYLLPDPRKFAWLNLEESALTADGTISGPIQDVIQVLDDPRFTILGDDGQVTLGQAARKYLEEGSFSSGNFEMATEEFGTSVSSVMRLVREIPRYGMMPGAGSPEAIIGDIVNAIRNAGYDGLTHKSGVEAEDVFIWWTKNLPLIRVDDISDEGLELLRVEGQISALSADMLRTQSLRESGGMYLGPGADSMRTVVQAGDDFVANRKLEEMLITYAREKGYGKVLLDDPSTVEGFRALFVPDMMATNQGYLDSLIPGQVAAAGRGKAQVMDLSPGAVNRQALEEFDPRLAKILFRGSNLSRDDRARLVMFMQQNNYTHILLPAGKGKEPVLTSASEIIGDSLTGLAYVRLGLKDQADELVASRLAKSPEYLRQIEKIDEVKKNLAASEAAVGTGQQGLRELGDLLERARPRAKRRTVTGGVAGEDRLEITGRQGQAKLETGEVFDPNEALSGQYSVMASSGGFHDLLLLGYMQNRYAQYERSLRFRAYAPSDEEYWLALSNLVNDNIRQDPFMRRLIRMDRIDRNNPDEVAAQNRAIMEDLTQDDAFLRAARSGLYDLSSLDTEINALRDKLYRWLPDDEAMQAASRGPLDPNYLQGKLAWRDDLVSIEEKDLIKIDNLYRRFINRAMNALGTVPEDTLIRHPFYRKRWLESMQSQVDAYEIAGVNSFSPAQLDAMRRQAHAFALKTTRETTYTVTRLSTPAAVLGLLIPFFPAWENAMRFWVREFAQRPDNLMRYVQAWNAPNSVGMVVDENGEPIEAKRGIFGLPDALFAPGASYIQFTLPKGLAEAADKIPFISTGTKGEVRIAKGALNVALQGDYPWLTNFGPLVSAPLSYFAAQRPDYAAALLQFEAGGLPIGEAIMKTAIPFGRPTAEKDILSSFSEQLMPATARRLLTAVTGWGDPQFVGTVEEIYRDMTIDWERNGRPAGEEPSMEEATNRAREFFALRFVASFAAFAAPSFQSKYQGELEEWRRISDKHQQIEESYKSFGISPPEDQPIGYQAALREFLNLHGPAFFYLTQSSSGRSGVGATVGEYEILRDHGGLASKLAGSDPDEDYVAMITSPYADDFSQPVYAWQMNRAFDNSTNLMRGGQPESVIDKGQIARGWIAYRDGMNELEALLEEAGYTSFEQTGAEMFKDAKALLELEIAQTNPAWERQRDKFDRGGWKDMIRNVEAILDDDAFMKAHGNEPLWMDVKDWYEARAEVGQILIQRKRELGDKGSTNINSSSNADIKMAWDLFIAEKKRENLVFAEWYNRFADYDTLLPGNPEDRLVLSTDFIDQQQPAMVGAQ